MQQGDIEGLKARRRRIATNANNAMLDNDVRHMRNALKGTRRNGFIINLALIILSFDIQYSSSRKIWNLGYFQLILLDYRFSSQLNKL